MEASCDGDSFRKSKGKLQEKGINGYQSLLKEKLSDGPRTKDAMIGFSKKEILTIK